MKHSRGRPGFPYVPELLSFRQAPLVLAALDLLADLPAIGCAKSILRGKHGPLDSERDSWVPLEDKGKLVGAALRTRDRVNPIYVTIGHKVDLLAAIRWVLACGGGYRMPESTRLARRAAAGKLEEREPERD